MLPFSQILKNSVTYVHTSLPPLCNFLPLVCNRELYTRFRIPVKKIDKSSKLIYKI